jgi:hypothetical protein
MTTHEEKMQQLGPQLDELFKLLGELHPHLQHSTEEKLIVSATLCFG